MPRPDGYRERLGLSRRAMAEYLLTARQTYEQWENGSRRTPGIAVIAAELARPRRAPRPATMTPARARVMELADGTRTTAEIAAALHISHNNVYARLMALRRLGERPVLRPSRRGSRPGNPNACAIAEAVRAGETYAAIGARYGITRERVRQVAKKHGARSSRPLAAEQRRRERAEAKAQQERQRQELINTLREKVSGGKSIAASGRELGLKRGRLSALSRIAKLGEITRWGRWK